MTRKTTLRGGIVAGLMTLAMLLSAAPAFAAGGPPPGGGGETTLGNNLSVPAIFVPNTTGAPTLRIGCPHTYQAPGADGVLASTTFPGYWLQKTEATWTADCTTAATATVTAQWGANLTDSPSIAAGKPIRVEVNLNDPTATGMRGYAITNLTPELADRLATYGTRGENGDAFVTASSGTPITKVWVNGAVLTIQKLVSGTYTTIYEASMTAEINATGAVVYGYNWGSKGQKNTPSAGDYRLTFTTPDLVSFNGVVPGTVNTPSYTTHTTSIDITLTPANRGGGRG